MSGPVTKEERLDYLIDAFKKDSGRYRDLPVPADMEGKRQILRSLMNIRLPGPMAEEVLRVQDDYLRERAREKGIVTLAEIPALSEAFRSSVPYADVFSVWQGDITRLACGAIVNAANSQMLGCFVPMHNCIDNNIHSFAGIQLRAACGERMTALRRQYGPDYEQPTGIPLLTRAYNLPCDYVIHVAGPIAEHALTQALETDLANCYRNSLNICEQNGIRSIAFCCISTGLFRFPNQRAAEIAVQTCTAWLDAHPGTMDRVIFNVFKDQDRSIYEELLK